MSYLTDEEKAERIKDWWKENGVAILGGLAIGIAGLFGWNWWTDRQDQQAQEASDLFNVVLSQFELGQYSQATALATELTERGRNTPYVAMAWALMADVAVRQGDPERAIQALEQARETARDKGYRQVLALRLARHLVAAERLTEAEGALAAVTSDAFAGLREELRGDIARARGQSEQARRHYEEAIAAGHDTEFLRLKLDELSV